MGKVLLRAHDSSSAQLEQSDIGMDGHGDSGSSSDEEDSVSISSLEEEESALTLVEEGSFGRQRRLFRKH